MNAAKQVTANRSNLTMKTLILFCLAIAALLWFSACEADGEHRRGAQITTTTTEESTIHRPVEATSETRTFRSY